MNKAIPSPQPLATADGSYTLQDPQTGLYYRSRCGALSESRYIFLEQSPLLQQIGPWRVLEIGLGGCLNFLVTAVAALQQTPAVPLHYHVVEATPITPEILTSLHYEQQFECGTLIPELIPILAHLQHHRTPLTVSMQQSRLVLTIYPAPWQAVTLPSELQVDAIYHDPFGPRDNPDCWQSDCFKWSTAHLAPHGRLVTYAAATHIRQAMVTAGLWVASAPGFARKREMTLAALSPSALAPYTLLNRDKYLCNAS